MDAMATPMDRSNIGFLHMLFASVDQGFCLCEIVTDAAGQPHDYRFLSVNALFTEITGLANPVGRTARELDPEVEPFWIETYGRVALARQPVRLRRQTSPSGRWFDIAAAPFGAPGQFVVIFRDISAEKRVEEERLEALGRSEALLQELNHRVMNSLGMIASIVGLESRARMEEEGRLALERVAARVHAVGELYRALSQARSGMEVRADQYIGAVADRLAASIAGGVRLAVDIEPIDLPTNRAAPLGLIVNELVTNSLKCAFEPGQQGEVRISLRRAGQGARLTVADDGRGLKGGRFAGGIGRDLVAAFAMQIEGHLDIESETRGTVVTLNFPLPEHIDGR